MTRIVTIVFTTFTVASLSLPSGRANWNALISLECDRGGERLQERHVVPVQCVLVLDTELAHREHVTTTLTARMDHRHGFLPFRPQREDAQSKLGRLRVLARSCATAALDARNPQSKQVWLRASRRDGAANSSKTNSRRLQNRQQFVEQLWSRADAAHRSPPQGHSR
jgi:hypothetical protein